MTMSECDCRFKYVDGEQERIWLATENSNLRSDLLKAHQEIERLIQKLDELDYYIEHSSTCATRYEKLRNCDCGLDEARRPAKMAKTK